MHPRTEYTNLWTITICCPSLPTTLNNWRTHPRYTLTKSVPNRISLSLYCNSLAVRYLTRLIVCKRTFAVYIRRPNGNRFCLALTYPTFVNTFLTLSQYWEYCLIRTSFIQGTLTLFIPLICICWPNRRYGCRGWIWTNDLLVMSQASFQTATTLRYLCSIIFKRTLWLSLAGNFHISHSHCSAKQS